MTTIVVAKEGSHAWDTLLLQETLTKFEIKKLTTVAKYGKAT
jgi:hypothetical protein